MSKSTLFGACLVLLVVNSYLYTKIAKAGWLEVLIAPFLGEDFSIALRLLIFLFAAGFVWFLGRLAFRALFKSDASFGESLNLSYLFILLALVATGALIFRGIFTWFLLPLFFALGLPFGLFVLWRAVGPIRTVLAILLSALMATATYLFAN